MKVVDTSKGPVSQELHQGMMIHHKNQIEPSYGQNWIFWGYYGRPRAFPLISMHLGLDKLISWRVATIEQCNVPAPFATKGTVDVGVGALLMNEPYTMCYRQSAMGGLE